MRDPARAGSRERVSTAYHDALRGDERSEHMCTSCEYEGSPVQVEEAAHTDSEKVAIFHKCPRICRPMAPSH